MSCGLRGFPASLFAIGRYLAVTAAVLCLLPAVGGQERADKLAAARAQYTLAESLRSDLEGFPEAQQTQEQFQKVITAYRKVYLITPQAPEVTHALVAAAELYIRMGRKFDPQFYQSAVDGYRFLIEQYPNSRFRPDAAFTIGKIEQDDLNQPAAAQETFRNFLQDFPKSSKAADARAALKELAKLRQEQTHANGSHKVAEQQEKQQALPRVTDIRTWNAENYTRVVVSLEDTVKYDGSRIKNPDRLYFDLNGARLNPALAGKSFDLKNGFLKAIRVAQNQKGVVRIVLDLDKVQDYSAFLLPDPYRLVIDVHGQPLATASTRASQHRSSPAENKENKHEARAAAAADDDQESPTHSAPVSPDAGGPTTLANAASRKPVKHADSDNRELDSENPVPEPSNTTRTRRPAQHDAEETQTAEVSPPHASRHELPAPSTIPKSTRDGQHSLTRELGLKISRIVIDAGHGGHDTGTVGPHGLMEKDLCLDVALRLGRLIENKLPGSEVVYTRKADVFVPLEDRTAIANQAKADLFVSIHANSSPDVDARGIETYYLNFASSEDAMQVATRENALSQTSLHDLQDLIKRIARNDKIEESKELAGDLQQSLTHRLQLISRAEHDRGVKKAPFIVLIGADMPSVLTEISFLSNPYDEKLLKRADQRQRVADGLFRGIEAYLRSLNSLSYNHQRPMSDRLAVKDRQ